MLVVLADHLTLDDFTRPDLPNLARMRHAGALALMSPGLAHKPDPVANVYATLGAGDSVPVGSVSQGRMGEALRRAGVRTALIGDADGDDTGPSRPARLFLPAPDVVSDGGAVPDPSAPGGKRQDPTRLWAATQAAARTCDLVVVHFGAFARAERENQRGFLLPAAYQSHRRRALRTLDAYLGRVLDGFHGPIFLVVPTPPLLPDGSWNSLTPFLAANATPGKTLTTDTTQTPGLIAARDIAPTVLAALHLPAPLQMTGAVVRGTDTPADLGRLDRQTRLNQDAQNPIFWTVGVSACVLVFSGLALFLGGRSTGRTGWAARYGLRLLSAWPLALLLAPLANPPGVAVYLLVIAALVGLLALLPSPSIIFALTALVLVGDGLVGTGLVSHSALSEYALSGIRFYGIGNEYMGVLLGGALLACVVKVPRKLGAGTGSAGLLGSESASGTEDKSAEAGRVFSSVAERLSLPSRPALLVPAPSSAPILNPPITFLWFALVTLVLSSPTSGAKAGGAVTATALFVAAWRGLNGRPVHWRHWVGGIGAGFVLVFLWAALSHGLHLRRTHLETATDALGSGRFGYIRGVTERKIGLALRVAAHPGTVLGLLAFGVLWLAARRWLWRQVTAFLHREPRFAAVWSAGLGGCLVALVFNDSGVVAAILILQCLVLALLHGLYSEPPEGRDAPAGS